MKIKKIPVIMVDYNEIEIWSLRKDEIVNHELVIKRSLKGDIYPKKLLNIILIFPIPSCKYYLKKFINMKLIILAAGDSYELDGFNKLTIKHPKYNMSIIDICKKIFNVNHIQLVVISRAMNIMNDYPDFDYILNNKWQTTGSL